MAECARRLLDPILLHFQFTFYISPSVPPLCQYSSVGAAAPRCLHNTLVPPNVPTPSRVKDCIFSLRLKFALDRRNPHLTQRQIRQTSIFQSRRWTFRPKPAVKSKEISFFKCVVLSASEMFCPSSLSIPLSIRRGSVRSLQIWPRFGLQFRV